MNGVAHRVSNTICTLHQQPAFTNLRTYELNATRQPRHLEPEQIEDPGAESKHAPNRQNNYLRCTLSGSCTSVSTRHEPRKAKRDAVALTSLRGKLVTVLYSLDIHLRVYTA